MRVYQSFGSQELWFNNEKRSIYLTFACRDPEGPYPQRSAYSLRQPSHLHLAPEILEWFESIKLSSATNPTIILLRSMRPHLWKSFIRSNLTNVLMLDSQPCLATIPKLDLGYRLRSTQFAIFSGWLEAWGSWKWKGGRLWYFLSHLVSIRIELVWIVRILTVQVVESFLTL